MGWAEAGCRPVEEGMKWLPTDYPQKVAKATVRRSKIWGVKMPVIPQSSQSFIQKKETPSLFSRRSIHKGRHFKNNPDFWIGGPFTSKVPQSLKKAVNWGDASYHGAHRVRWGGRRGWA